MSQERRESTEEIIRKTREKYGDIIDLPYPIQKKHPPMPMSDRAAQFSPFAAMSVHGEYIKEAERLMEEMMEEETEE